MIDLTVATATAEPEIGLMTAKQPVIDPRPYGPTRFFRTPDPVLAMRLTRERRV